MQYKIPQDVDVEDKIFGPFTLKQFGFVFVAIIVAAIFLAILTKVGMSLAGAAVVGSFFGSFFIIAGFVPFNGKPLYMHTQSFLWYFLKPRRRVWKKMEVSETPVAAPVAPEPQTTSEMVIPKEQLESMGSKIQQVSLMVDTGGAFGHQLPEKEELTIEPEVVFNKESEILDQTIREVRQKIEEKKEKPEPTVSTMATVDPNKQFNYQQPDTSAYELEKSFYMKKLKEKESSQEKTLRKF